MSQCQMFRANSARNVWLFVRRISDHFAQFQAIQAAKGADASLSGFHVQHRDALVVHFESP